jgi:hypothetical protein
MKKELQTVNITDRISKMSNWNVLKDGGNM